MGLRDRLGRPEGRPPLLFEPVPPPKDTPEDEIGAHLGALESALARIPHLDGVNVPQILGGAYETVDAFEYAGAIQSVTGIDTMVNLIVAHVPEAELPARIAEAHATHGIDHLVLVGGESSQIDYPGPTVGRANLVVSRLQQEAGRGTIGNICIPFRRRPGNDEPDRMVTKTQAGADHFTSQIILEPVTTRRLLRDYDRACRLAGVQPATVFIGLAPVTEPRDLKLLKHLGVEVPPHVERDLLWDKDAMGERSLEMNLGILRHILSAVREERIRVPVGLNVEQVSLHNWDASVELAEEATLLLEDHHYLTNEKHSAPVASSPGLPHHTATPTLWR